MNGRDEWLSVRSGSWTDQNLFALFHACNWWCRLAVVVIIKTMIYAASPVGMLRKVFYISGQEISEITTLSYQKVRKLSKFGIINDREFNLPVAYVTRKTNSVTVISTLQIQLCASPLIKFHSLFNVELGIVKGNTIHIICAMTRRFIVAPAYRYNFD